MKRLVIFDLDGTLLDTIADLGAATNYAMTQMGFPTHSLDEYCFKVGNGITRLIERALPENQRDEATVGRAREYFLAFYSGHNTQMTQPYPGIQELLSELTNRGIGIAVASNKYQDATAKLIATYFGHLPWTAIEGHRAGRPTKPDPLIVNDILRLADVQADEALYVGDSGVDMDTARNASIESVGVTWGFRPESELSDHGANHIVNRPEQIIQLLN